MRSLTSLAIIITAIAGLTSCIKEAPRNSSTTGAFRSNSAAPTTRMFDRRSLNVTGFRHLDEFIRPEVREKLDVEPVGESDVYLPPTFGSSGESVDAETQEPFNEENPTQQLEIDKAKFQWAKKKFGDALAADAAAMGVIILYADENYYDLGRLNAFVDEGRGRIATESGIDPARIQIVYGGYRGMAQVEMWIVPAGEQRPELKPENRDAQPEQEL